MRLIVGVLACMAASAVTVAVADPPAAPTAAASATASTTPTPAAAAPAAASATAAVADEDREMRAAGYKPQMKGGQKVWCRQEDVSTGSHLSRGKETCNSAEVIKERIKSGRDLTERAQHNQLNKTGG